ncbi:MAG: hypothetical protein BV459_01815 [Thermoplasmata archaeon M11B2D]|nr:MAG: hypothetical protein BV459_01815 [Thermoplasmata archaeon M11B2D]
MYFENFSNISYLLDDTVGDRIVRNIMKKIGIKKQLKTSASLFITYKIQENERPEEVAYKMYGSTEYHWVVLLMNDIKNRYYDWPLTQDEVRRLTEKKYGIGNESATHHYVDLGGYVVDASNPEAQSVSNLDYEFDQNETRREIKVLDPEYLSLAVSELETIMRN